MTPCPGADGTLGRHCPCVVKPTRASFFRMAAREYLSGGSCVTPRSESRLRRTTEALLGSSKRSREPQAHNLLFQIRHQPTSATAAAWRAFIRILSLVRNEFPIPHDQRRARRTLPILQVRDIGRANLEARR